MASLAGDPNSSGVATATGTFAADGIATAFVLTHKRVLELVVWGTGGNNFGGGTVTCKFSPDGGTTFISIAGVSINANGSSGAIIAAQGHQFQVILTGSTSPSLKWAVYDVAGD